MIHFYPGMGASSAMYSGRWRELPDSVFHDWPEWKGELTITELALRLIDEHGIQNGDVVAGTSLGGMVACEISNLLDLDRLILIAGVVNKEEINGLLTILLPLIDLAPLEFLRISAGKVPHELSTMFSESEPDFIRSMCKAIFSWEGLNRNVEITRIHGRNDLVIPLPEGVDNPIDGGHLIAMTHAEECVERLGFCPARPSPPDLPIR